MHGKLVIATGIGGNAEMLAAGNERAGVMVGKNDDGHASVPELTDALIRFAEDREFRDRCRRLALEARERFHMEPCLDQYMAIFRGEDAFAAAGIPVRR